MVSIVRSRVLGLALGGLAAADASAQSSPALWEIGAVGLAVSQQAYPGSDHHVRGALPLPFLIYRGEILRADRGGAGIRALRTPTFELDIGFAGSFGSSADDIDARRGMPDLGTRVEFGPRLKWNLGAGPGGGRWRAEFPLRGVFDLSDGLAHRGIAFEPEAVFERRTAGGLAYSTSLGAVIGDHRLNDSFYGVAPRFATNTRPAYVARSGLIAWRLSASLSQEIGADWRWFAFARLDSVAGAANVTSPLVRQRQGVTVGAGLSYTWLRSRQRAVD